MLKILQSQIQIYMYREMSAVEVFILVRAPLLHYIHNAIAIGGLSILPRSPPPPHSYCLGNGPNGWSVLYLGPLHHIHMSLAAGALYSSCTTPPLTFILPLQQLVCILFRSTSSPPPLSPLLCYLKLRRVCMPFPVWSGQWTAWCCYLLWVKYCSILSYYYDNWFNRLSKIRSAYDNCKHFDAVSIMVGWGELVTTLTSSVMMTTRLR